MQWSAWRWLTSTASTSSRPPTCWSAPTALLPMSTSRRKPCASRRYAEHPDRGPGKVPAQPRTVSLIGAASSDHLQRPDAVHLGAEEAAAEPLERRRVARGQEPVARRGKA